MRAEKCTNQRGNCVISYLKNYIFVRNSLIINFFRQVPSKMVVALTAVILFAGHFYSPAIKRDTSFLSALSYFASLERSLITKSSLLCIVNFQNDSR